MPGLLAPHDQPLSKPLAPADSSPRVERRKLWELPQSYAGLLLSLAMSSKEMTRLIRYHPEAKEAGKITEIMMISELSNAGQFAKLVGKQLDKKYKQGLRRYQGCNNLKQLLECWRQSLEQNDLAEGFWCMLSHGMASEEVLAQCFWELTRILAMQNRTLEKNRLTIKELEERMEGLEERLKGSASLLEQRNSDQQTIRNLELELQQSQAVLAERGDALNTDYQRLYKETSKLLKKSEYANQRQQQLIRDLQAELQQSSFPETVAWKTEDSGLHDSSATAQLSVAPEDCRNCDSWEQSLCGRSVLYVGGRTRQVARLRKMVEVHGGRFVHHDGGLHDGFSRLKEVVDCADVVLCPLNCISHNASGHIKKCCKQANKPLCFLRTSGVSAFNEGLKKAMEHDGISLVS